MPPRRKRPVKPGNELINTHPTLALKWHPTLNQGVKPDQVSKGVSTEYWWFHRVEDTNIIHEWYVPLIQ